MSAQAPGVVEAAPPAAEVAQPAPAPPVDNAVDLGRQALLNCLASVRATERHYAARSAIAPGIGSVSLKERQMNGGNLTACGPWM